MKLASIARYFDDTRAYDGYTGSELWKCQFSSFNDANVVGSTSTRRTLSIAPDLAIPTRRCLRIFDDRWLVGDGNPDSWKGKVIRQSFNMKKATDLSEILTPAQACLSAAGVQAYSHRTYLKDTVNALNDANYDAFWNIFFAPGEPVARGKFIRNGTAVLRVRNDYVPLEDLRIAQCDEIDGGPLVATLGTGAYDLATDSFAAGTATVNIILIDFVKLYGYQTRADARVAAGDMNALLPKSQATPRVNQVLTFNSEGWRILASATEQDCWLLHLRRA